MTCLALLFSACQATPKPCDCGKAEADLMRYTDNYLDAIEDIGNLKQQLKACNQKTMLGQR